MKVKGSWTLKAVNFSVYEKFGVDREEDLNNKYVISHEVVGTVKLALNGIYEL